MDQEGKPGTFLTQPVSRRGVLAWGAAVAATPALSTLVSVTGADAAVSWRRSATLTSFDLEEASILEMQYAMRTGRVSSRELVAAYLARIAAIDESGPSINAIIEVNPDALAIAELRDQERAAGRTRGPLHGIPIVIKDNINTGDRMQTTAGSLALVGTPAPWDATVARKLRQAGAVILAKTNLSEWANFRSLRATSGWSGQGGLTLNPYVLDRNACGSSSGSPAAVAANLAAGGLGTETDGSIVCPSSTNGVVGIKPTLGLTSRMGVIPIAHSQDVVGPMGRTVADAAAILNAISGFDRHDPATRGSIGRRARDYTGYAYYRGLRGVRLGVLRSYFGASPKTDLVITRAIREMRHAGATVVDVAMPSLDKLDASGDEFTVLLYEFKADIAKYLRNRGNTTRMRTLADLIRFNRNHRAQELRYFDQSIFLLAQAKGPLSDPAYRKALANSKLLTRQQGIDAVMDQHRLDALVAPTNGPAWTNDLINGDNFKVGSSTPAAVAGYPSITVPAGFIFELPIGVSFFGRAWSEPMLLRIASGFEAHTRARRPPKFLSHVP